MWWLFYRYQNIDNVLHCIFLQILMLVDKQETFFRR